MHRARGVALIHVERGEVVPVVLDLRTRGDREAEIGEDLGKLVHHLGNRVDRAFGQRARGQGQVDRLARKLRFERGSLERGLARLECLSHFGAHRLDARARLGALLGRHLPQRLEGKADPALLAERCHALLIERLKVMGCRDRCEGGTGLGGEICHRVWLLFQGWSR